MQMQVMSLRKYSAVQSFSSSVPAAVDRLTELPSPLPSGPCCSSSHAACFRPVLCSKVLRNVTQSNQLHPAKSNIVEISNYHKTPSGDAWVEHEKYPTIAEQLEHLKKVKLHTEQVENYHQEKADKLIKFQREVKRRVKRREEEKQQAMLAKTYVDVELERKVAHKTAFLAQACIPNASEVMVQGRSNLIVKDRQLVHPGARADGVTGMYTDTNISEINKLHQSIEHESKLKKCARRKLGSKQIRNNADVDLPGGFWKDTSHVEFPAPPDEMLSVSLDGEERDMNDLCLDADSMNLSNGKPTEVETADQQTSKGTHTRRMGRPLLISGQDQEEIRKQEVKQRALLRRLYMDIEREQVKEYKKMKLHLNRIIHMKRTKEEERARQEHVAAIEMLVPPRPPLASPGTFSGLLEQQKEVRRTMESRRYIKALRCMLKEKIDRQGVDVPPLCSCGDDIWATHPDLCANNCPFYKNPKRYERAVQSLLTSCNIHD